MSPQITSTERRRGGIIAVTIDGCGDPHLLPLETFMEHGLRDGLALDQAGWDRLRVLGAQKLALRKAIAALARRQRTEAELRELLVGADFEAGIVDHTIGRLRELKYVDDAAWARSYVARDRSEQRGNSLLRMELLRHGVARDVIDPLLDDRDERARAVAAAESRVRSLRRAEPDARRRRLYGFLVRRGFGHSTAREAVAEVLAD